MAKVLSDILMALDRGDIAALALLDLSAAFDANATVPTKEQNITEPCD